jgi:uncharacterized protein YkwD
LLYNIPMKYLKWTIPITAILAILFVGLGIYVTQAEKPVQSAVKSSQAQIEPLNADKILSLVNAERAKVGVAPLTSDPRLVQSAQFQADDMATNDYFSHINPTTGKHGYEYIPSGYCLQAGENLAWIKYPTEKEDNQETIDNWLDSPLHKEAMLSSTNNLVGISINGEKVVMHLCQQ